MLRVVLVCKLNDNTVNERFKYQCSIDVKNTTFRAHTRYQVKRVYFELILPLPKILQNVGGSSKI